MTTTWAIAVDWNRNGQFDGTHENITDYVISANWFLGFRKAYQHMADDSRLELVLNNEDKRFSPERTSGPLEDNVRPFRKVRVSSQVGETERIHWIGWIESIQPMVGKDGERQVTITASGTMQFFRAAEAKLILQENRRTDQIIAQLIGAVELPPAAEHMWILGRPGNTELHYETYLVDVGAVSSLERGKVTLAFAADNWVKQGNRFVSSDTMNVLQAILNMTETERGHFFFNRVGKAIFWNRNHLLRGDDAEDIPFFDNSMIDLAYGYATGDEFKNEITVSCRPRTISAGIEVLWKLPEAITIPAGKTQKITAKYTDGSDRRIGGKDVTLGARKFDKGTATISLKQSANSAEITIRNSSSEDAVLSTLVVRGKMITDYDAMDAVQYDANSITDYGRRSLMINLPSLDKFAEAQRIARFELRRRKEPRGWAQAITLKSHAYNGGDFHDEQLDLTIGSLIALKEDQTEHGFVDGPPQYFIMGEAHRLNGQILETTWYLEPAPMTDLPWKVGVEERSNIGESTHLSY